MKAINGQSITVKCNLLRNRAEPTNGNVSGGGRRRRSDVAKLINLNIYTIYIDVLEASQ